jgi:hypothetical protein
VTTEKLKGRDVLDPSSFGIGHGDDLVVQRQAIPAQPELAISGFSFLKFLS